MHSLNFQILEKKKNRYVEIQLLIDSELAELVVKMAFSSDFTENPTKDFVLTCCTWREAIPI